MHWPLTETRRQPYEDLILIAADHLLEHEQVEQQSPRGTRGAASPSAARRKVETTEYRLKPRPKG